MGNTKTAPLLKKSASKKPVSYYIKREYTKNKYLYLMALPVIIYYLVFHYGTIYGATIAFKDYNISDGIWGSPWVGLKHFSTFLHSYNFWRLLKNTLLISLYSLLFGFPAPILLALLLNELRLKKFKNVVQTITYLPHFISTVVICGLIHTFLARDGFITSIIAALGGEATNYLAKPEYFRTIFVASDVWQTIGWNSIIYLSALTGIDPQLYEAVEVDGGGRFRKLWNITLPGIAPTIIILFIMKIGHVMTVGYEKIILLYNPNTYETADVISSYVYRTGLGESFQYSFTTAVGLFTSVINYVLVVSVNSLSRKINGNSLW